MPRPAVKGSGPRARLVPVAAFPAVVSVAGGFRPAAAHAQPLVSFHQARRAKLAFRKRGPKARASGMLLRVCSRRLQDETRLSWLQYYNVHIVPKRQEQAEELA